MWLRPTRRGTPCKVNVYSVGAKPKYNDLDIKFYLEQTKYLYVFMKRQFLGALTKLRRATNSFVISVCVYVRPFGTVDFQWTDFH